MRFSPVTSGERVLSVGLASVSYSDMNTYSCSQSCNCMNTISCSESCICMTPISCSQNQQQVETLGTGSTADSLLFYNNNLLYNSSLRTSPRSAASPSLCTPSLVLLICMRDHLHQHSLDRLFLPASSSCSRCVFSIYEKILNIHLAY